MQATTNSDHGAHSAPLIYLKNWASWIFFSSNPLQIAKFMFHYYKQLFVRDVSQLLVTNIQVHIYRMGRDMQ